MKEATAAKGRGRGRKKPERASLADDALQAIEKLDAQKRELKRALRGKFEGFAPSEAEAAEALGVSDRQFRRWRSEPWFPADARTAVGWDVEKIKTARDLEGLKGSELTDRRTRQIVDERTQVIAIKRTEAEIRRLKLEAARGGLLPRDSVELHIASLYTAVVDFCKQLPRIIAPSVPLEHQPVLLERLTQELDQWRLRIASEAKRAAAELDQQVEIA